MPRAPAFAPSLDAVQAGFHRVWEGLRAPDERRHKALRAIRLGLWSGDSDKGRRELARALRGTDWEWPFLIRWADEFATAGIWPLVWSQADIISPIDWAEIDRDLRIRLLAQEIEAAAYIERNIAQYLDPDIRPVCRLELAVGDQRCPCSKMLWERHHAAIARDDLSARPPFFPGDTNYLKVETGKLRA